MPYLLISLYYNILSYVYYILEISYSDCLNRPFGLPLNIVNLQTKFGLGVGREGKRKELKAKTFSLFRYDFN